MKPWSKILLIAWVSAAGCAQTAPSGSTPLPLSLRGAVQIALEPQGSVRVQMAEEMIRQAKARSGQARAALLPDVSTSISQQSQTRNLAAMGIRFQSPFPGFSFPTFVGPFNTFDARASLTQSVFDFSAIRRYQASRVAVRQAQAEGDATRDLVAGQAARAYLTTTRAQAAVETAQANVELAEALAKLAADQKEAGTGTSIEVTRARVQMANERQRLLVAENERTRARLQLLKILGLRLTTEVRLTDKLEYTAAPAMAAEEALAKALETRAEWQAQLRREETAKLTHSATQMERLPSLASFADYGSIGSSINHAVPTRTFGLALRLPIFDGGRRDARRAESASLARQEAVRTRDVHDQIELEIRVALDNLRSAEGQVQAAREGSELADNELAQARRRYGVGMTNGIEVTDAQTRLARARENLINALFNHNLAKIDLTAAMGTIRQALP